ncbi:MAG: DUF1376 domain-containing protein [Rhodovibrio sp.]|nr:DUF1376 domain-containing protein [Rhodovibrio sp.]
MAEFLALPLWTDAYLADTTDLSAEEHGVYMLLLMAAWRTPTCSLPDDDLRLARMAKAGTKKWRKMRPVMERFFTVSDGQWSDPAHIWKPSARRSLSKSVRGRILARDGERCAYCGVTRSPFDIDHIWPVAAGGTDDETNLTVACQHCNRSKSSKTIEQWGRC